MNTNQIKQKIQELFPDVYPEKNLPPVLKDIDNFDPILRQEFETYLTTGQKTTRQIEGYTATRLNDYGMNDIGAFLTLSWLTREPEKAKSSLKKGYDFIK